MRPSARAELAELKLRFEVLHRAAIRVIASHDPAESDESTRILVQDLAIAAGCSSQVEAIALIEGQWKVPVRSSNEPGVFVNAPTDRRGRA